jgi:hypothetical protein
LTQSISYIGSYHDHAGNRESFAVYPPRSNAKRPRGRARPRLPMRLGGRSPLVRGGHATATAAVAIASPAWLRSPERAVVRKKPAVFRQKKMLGFGILRSLCSGREGQVAENWGLIFFSPPPSSTFWRGAARVRKATPRTRERRCRLSLSPPTTRQSPPSKYQSEDWTSPADSSLCFR